MPLDRNISYILGVLCGDGGLVDIKRPQERPRFYLVVKDFDFAKHTEQCWKAVSGEIGCRQWSIVRPVKSRDGFWIFRSSSRVVDILMEYFEPGEKCLTWRVPNIIFESGEDVRLGFLKGFFDSEGCVETGGRRRRVSASSSNPYGLDDVRRLLDSVGIRCWVNGGKVFISGRENIMNFEEMVGFRLKRQTDKLHTLLGSYSWAEPRRKYDGSVCGKIAEMHAVGLSTRKIESALRIPKSTVSKYIKEASG